MERHAGGLELAEAVSISLFLDDASQPFATYKPPASVTLDTTQLTDGEHLLHIRATDAMGKVGVRAIPFVVQNGPGITVTGLRSNELVSGSLRLDVNAFSASDPFDPLQAESSGPIPVWTWVLIVLIAAWGSWYGIAEFQTPPSFASTPTYEANPMRAAAMPLQQHAPPAYSGRGAAAGFDYAKTGPNLYAANCEACHGAAGTGVPGAFPSLMGDPVVTAHDPTTQIKTVLHGLSGKTIRGKSYSGAMPPFAQLSDDDIAAIIDHERTTWGNNAPIITPDEVKRAR
jgi:cytochrome c oxidase subunit 2